MLKGRLAVCYGWGRHLRIRKVGNMDIVPKKWRTLYVIGVIEFLSLRKCKVERLIFLKNKHKNFLHVSKWRRVDRDNEGKPSWSKEAKSAILFPKDSQVSFPSENLFPSFFWLQCCWPLKINLFCITPAINNSLFKIKIFQHWSM